MCQSSVTETRQDCTKRSVVYEISCQSDKCQLEPSSSSPDKPRPAHIYVGETARAGWERSREHVMRYKKKLEDSCMYKHVSDCHRGEEPPTFSMRVVKQHQTAFRRQIGEAVRIRSRVAESGVHILNSQGMYNRAELPRLVVDKVLSRAGGPTNTAPKRDKKASPPSSQSVPVENIVSSPNSISNKNDLNLGQPLPSPKLLVQSSEAISGNDPRPKVKFRRFKLRKKLVDSYKHRHFY